MARPERKKVEQILTTNANQLLNGKNLAEIRAGLLEIFDENTVETGYFKLSDSFTYNNIGVFDDNDDGLCVYDHFDDGLAVSFVQSRDETDEELQVRIDEYDRKQTAIFKKKLKMREKDEREYERLKKKLGK